MIISGQKTVTTAGTAVRLSASTLVANCAVMVKALLGNTGNVFIGNVTDDVSSSNGLQLSAGDVVLFDHVGDLYELWIDSAVNGEGVSWILLSV